jgi:hypothetical protein
LPAKMFSLRTAQPAQVSKTLYQIDSLARGRDFSHFVSHFPLLFLSTSLRPAAALQPHCGSFFIPRASKSCFC